MKRYLLLIVILLVSAFSITAQNPAIKVIGKVKNDTVLLRWAPSNSVAWQLGNKYGYKVYRYAVKKQKDSLYAERELVASSLKPRPLDDWEPLVKNNKYAAIAAQALYGETFAVSNPGANTMDFINQVNENENRFGFSLYAADLSPIVAEAMGLRLKDVLPDSTIKWAYSVEIVGNQTNYSVDRGIAVIDPNEKLILPPPSEVKGEFHDHKVRLSWVSLYDYGIYVAYIIERSEDGGKSFTTRSKVPMAIISKTNHERRHTYFIDSLEVNYKAYHYRVRGISPFGETGPPSKVVFGAGVGSAAGVMASIDSAVVTTEGAGYLHWDFPRRERQKIAGFTIGRASTAKGPFKEISRLLKPEAREFTDPFPAPVNYYVVKAIGKDSITTKSMPVLIQLLDSIPPATPVGLKGMIDTTGMVHLDWLPNKEKDVAGYRIFRANDLSEEFIQLTTAPAKFSDYIDEISLKNLTEDIYYKIVAVDQHDNPSDYSLPLKLKKPDVVAPTAPIFTSWYADEDGISLQWINSSSKDVVEHILIRSDQEGKEVKLQIQEGQVKFTDKEVVGGSTYSYSLIAVDDAGLKSASKILTIAAFNNGILPVINEISGKAERERRRIKISWKYTHEGVKKYLIYRSKAEEPMRLIKAVNGNEQVFIDYNISVNNIYSYRIKAVFENDDESQLSKKIVVDF